MQRFSDAGCMASRDWYGPSSRVFSGHLVANCPVHGFDCALDPHDGVAGQLFRVDLLKALDERPASDDELLAYVGQHIDFGHDSFSNSFVA
jgi:hypothetical protein